jgi:hypothetical protein
VDPRLTKLRLKHAAPLMQLISDMRRRWRNRDIPNIDPDDGGAQAKVLVRQFIERRLGEEEAALDNLTLRPAKRGEYRGALYSQ